ncbi:MAG: PSD1 and planctomycete cytochrome C domain-containing protein [Isosphaeraceae bacterium]
MNPATPMIQAPTPSRPLARRAAAALSLAALLSATTFVPAGEPGPGPGPEPDHARAKRSVDFNREVRPILAKNCFACHGQDEARRAKKLRLDVREAAITPLEDGNAAIVPGDPDSSELVERITTDDESLRMPPRKTGHRLTSAEVDTLKTWIEQGANYARHWALIPPAAQTLPAARDGSWPRNGIDRWILARLESEGLKPSPEADPYTLLRRASLDLRGLPPSPAEVERFINDRKPGAYERAVDRFLDDPAYGERWARMWLDLARYADSAGYGSDPLRPDIWPYRDWVIAAFNRNLPFDRFTLLQIAGDLAEHPSLDDRIATAFHRNTMTNTEGGTDDEEFRVAAIKDRVDTTIQVWMGLTAGCAKCHSHKFDPITQEEYYRLYAIFNQTADADRGDESPTVPFPVPAIMKQNREIDAKIAALRAGLSKSTPAAEAAKVKAQVDKLEKSRPKPPNVPVMQELPPLGRRKTHLLRKGNFLDPGQAVEPGVPAALHPLPAGKAADRMALARWLVDPANPLTARVAVNRYWAQLFGVGLVETEEDFGTQGEPPSHPELLDWLAMHYRESGWDTKALIRLIVTSATYRQSSRVRPELMKKDPRNRLLARAPRNRLEAEMVRDQALALSGLLSRKVGGPSVFPPQPDGLWQAAFNGERTWSTSAGDDRYRRGLYVFWRRTVPYPSMAAFDAPSREICAIRRVRTNTPLQSFVTMNDPVYVEAAQALARRIVRDGGRDTTARMRFALTLCQCRPPRPEQIEPLLALHSAELDRYRKDRAAAVALATEPIGPAPAGVDPADLAAWTAVANVLLNLDSVLSRG